MTTSTRSWAVAPRLLVCFAVILCVLGLGEAGAAGSVAARGAPQAAAAALPAHAASHEVDGRASVTPDPHGAVASTPSVTPAAAGADTTVALQSAALLSGVDAPSGRASHGHGGVHGPAIGAVSCMVALTVAAALVPPGWLAGVPSAVPPAPAEAGGPLSVISGPAHTRAPDQSVLCIQRV